MNYADIRQYDIANGQGIGTTLFVSGCHFHCKGCFNKDAWNFDYGNKFTKEVEDKLIKWANSPRINHVSLLGGEVFHQDLDIILSLVKRIKKEVSKPIYIWTGFTWDTLISDSKRLEILQYVDLIIDGKFDESKHEMGLTWYGSTNQRVIDVQKSLKNGKIIIFKK